MADLRSRRQRILEVLFARVQEITVAHGFDTDAGLNVFLGEQPELGPDDPETALAIVVGDEVPTFQGENLFIQLPIEIRALAKADLDQPWLMVERVLSDIKRAVEISDRTLGGLVKRMIMRGPVRTVDRQEGNTTIGIGIIYICPFSEGWGTP